MASALLAPKVRPDRQLHTVALQDALRLEARRRDRATELFAIAARTGMWSVALRMCDIAAMGAE